MTPREIAAAKRAHARARALGTTRPICRVCGKSDRRCRYEPHHIVLRFARRRLSEVTVLLCKECHDRASDMQNDFPPLDSTMNPAVALKINRNRGIADLLRLVAEELEFEADEHLAHFQLQSSKPE